jgi:hypothetical protein
MVEVWRQHRKPKAAGSTKVVEPPIHKAAALAMVISG